ncbi:NAD(P)/FAD-dependent oxidoreductase [Cupriavidus basilensis]|uniref:NAD(P)/FAD-dependent oxidoreductase n=1 Tax=Cupriavidus basilensis TaxID=68895 RepID=UPI00157B2E59|nr:FAD-dependent oxidoreductase [Cupriavidus basilensis]NUA29478.1 FAD-dependent oxidoreductase [Cupriavidus basilensis]
MTNDAITAKTQQALPLVILGTGLAGYTLAREFRKRDSATPLVIVTRDAGESYSKPMLSNALAGNKAPATLAIASAQQMAAQLNARVMTHADASAIDTGAGTVLVDGQPLRYGQLVLALGAQARAPGLQGDGADAVQTVNDLADYTRFHASLQGKRRVAILGAGLIGCEFANDLHAGGFDVELVDPAAWPLGRLLPGEAGELMAGALRGLGVRLHLGEMPVAVQRRDGALAVQLASGEQIAADVVLSATGLLPRVALAQAAGIATARGIVVDRLLRTSAPSVYALGDCAEVDGLVLPYVMPLMQAARALARTLAGTPTPLSYSAMPVVVKTPVLPAVVSPALGGAGYWDIESQAAAEEAGAGLRALFRDTQGALTGFALLGKAVAEKGALAKQIGDWLPVQAAPAAPAASA